MARKKGKSEDVEFVIDDEEEQEPVKSGGVERYEVRIGPPVVKGRSVKPTHTEQQAGGTETDKKTTGSGTVKATSAYPGPVSFSGSAATTQQIYKIEDELKRTRDIVEDLRHTVGILEGEVRDLKSDMERATYLLRSFEGLKNAMKDIESTVSELSGLYDMISANINPFIDIPPLQSRGSAPAKENTLQEEEGGASFQELEEIFEGEQDMGWDQDYLESEEWILRWTKFLIDKVGKEGLEKILVYYQDLGWIDDELTDRVVDIARGTPSYARKEDAGKKISWKMDAEDHVKSLEFIRKIRR
ncbi:MAG: FlaD/FlaE family flagellar protein [Thermoplasmatota archaeon]